MALTNETISSVLHLTLSLAGVWILWSVLWRDLSIDIYRDSLFRVRDELFLMAADGKISFDHPAYGQLRLTINGSLRFAHTLSVLDLVFLVAQFAFDRRHNTDDLAKFSSRFAENIRDLPPDVRKDLTDLRNRTHLLVIKQLVRRNPLSVVPLFLLTALLAVFLPVRDVSEDAIDARAELEGVRLQQGEGIASFA